ncbi:MAG TPA: heat-inducible transcriptional repressor HrcA [Candidatus Binataceae bacterium]|nr:heat-inducible transcriptional repressor HrcA [Candidatus Binataceae bacterium]
MEGGARDSEAGRRRHALLLATVQEFIATAEPVGSHQIVSRHPFGVRAAMVRNMMAELEEAGYLRQPHTSAGRVPTDRAFRYYVDHLMGNPRIGFVDRTQIELHYSAEARGLTEVVRDTSRFLALLTGQVALVTAPRLDDVVLERVSFVRLRAHEVLAIFVAVAGKGSAQNRLVQADQDFSQEELDRMARYLNESLQGRSLDEARRWIEERLHEDRARYDGFMRAALALGGAIAGRPAPAEVYVEGSAKVADQPEFTDHNRLRELLRTLEDRTALLDLLERSFAKDGLTVSIGSENFDARLASLSIVATSYQSGAMPLGSLAIVGPVRMDYERLIPLVNYTARALSRRLEPSS